MRTPVVAGNWKMNTTPLEGAHLAADIIEIIGKDPGPVDVILCPPFPGLLEVAAVTEGTRIEIGAQDLHHADAGAFTGSVSGPMLSASGCRFVLVGHSERRQHCRETVQVTSQKLLAAYRSDLLPILCVGENAGHRDAGQTFEVVGEQLGPALDLDPSLAARLIVAYEPVWAIGSGAAASPGDAQEVGAFIRHRMENSHGESLAQSTRILYGGSVNPGNIETFMGLSDIDGVLVGGASLQAETFARLVLASKEA